jgi:histidyl-tRNA synthetase
MRMPAHFCRTQGEIPATGGAYVLWVDLPRPLAVSLPGKSKTRLRAGRYLYCGSAHGPGGLHARVGRHMRRAKTIRWHIDRLSEVGIVQGAFVFSDASECELVASLALLPVPIPGFGSSDCKTCRSHLLRWPERLPLPFEEANGKG